MGAFACVEHLTNGDFVVGNVIAGDQLWVVLIPDAPGVDYDPELSAMVEILSQLPSA